MAYIILFNIFFSKLSDTNIDCFLLNATSKVISKKKRNTFYLDIVSHEIDYIIWIFGMPKRIFENTENDEISNFYFDPVIIHLAGIRRRDRIKFIKKYKKIFI